MVFSRVFAACANRDEAIGMFIALLELTRLGRVTLQQAAPFSEIYVCLAEQAATLEPVLASAPEPAPAPEPPSAPVRPIEIKTVDVLSEIEETEEEAESLGRARERIDIALARVEAFLKEHHQQTLEQHGNAEPEESEGMDAERPAGAAPAADGDAAAPAEGEIKNAAEGPALDQHQQP